MSKSTNPQFVSEMEMRVLAVLKLNDGIIEDHRGHAVARVWRLSTIEHRDATAGAIKRLCEKGLVIKDIRSTTPKEGRVDKDGRPIPATFVGSRCYAVAMVDDSYPVDDWAMDELKEQIKEKMAKAGKEPVFRHPRKTDDIVPAASEVKVYRADREDEDRTPEEKIADAILAKVFYHVQNPLVIERAVVKADPELEMELSKVRLANDTLKKRVEELATENEGLKRQLSEAKGQLAKRARGGALQQSIRDSLSDEEWAKLMQQKPKEKGK